LHQFLPIELLACLDEGSDFDLIGPECQVRFCTVERPASRREDWIGAGIDIVLERLESEIDHCRAENDWLLSGGVTRKGALVEAGAWLSRIYSTGSVSNGQSSSELSESAKRAAQEFIALFRLEPEI
jgi:hypothetical protein